MSNNALNSYKNGYKLAKKIQRLASDGSVYNMVTNK